MTALVAITSDRPSSAVNEPSGPPKPPAPPYADPDPAPDVLRFGADIPLPPRDLMFMDPDHGAMLATANGLLDLPKRLGLYTPDTPVMDIGCGYGRLAYALLRNGQRAPYFGVDILPRHVAWLRSNLTPHLPAGSAFAHLDVLNDRYNPEGSIAATDATLPRPSWAPGLVLLFSVFTHMYPEDVAHYAGELGRLLPPGAASCMTFFLLNSEARELAASERSAFSFRHRHSDICFCFDEMEPLHAVAYDEAWVHGMLRSNGLTVEHVAYGKWCGRVGARVFQDTLLVRRTV